MSIRKHSNTIHGNIEDNCDTFKCKLCDKKFKDEENAKYMSHSNTIHGSTEDIHEGTSFKCKLCKKG